MNLTALDLEDIRIEKTYRAKQSLATFLKQAWHVIEPGTPLKWNWHLDAVCEHLEAVYHGQITRLVANIAPGHAKSTLFSVAFPSWCWINDPSSRWLCASHSLDLAIRDNNNCRALIESVWYQSQFGDVLRLKDDQNTKSFFENTQRGYRLATSVGAKGTGKRGTHLLIDDPNDARATSADLEATIRWFSHTWLSRLNDMQGGAMIVVGQRLNERDLSGYILQNLKGWEHFNLPTEYESTRKCTTSIGWSDPRTHEGDLLWEEKFPKPVLQTLKQGLGSMNYAAQYQQSPVPADGGIFKKSWLRYYSKQDDYYELEKDAGNKRVFADTCRRLMTADVAISEKQSADYTVIAVWAISQEHDIILLDLFRDRIDNPTQQKQLRRMYQRWQPEYALIESVAYQLALVQQLRNEGLAIREYKPGRGDKVSRATTASVKFEGEKIFTDKHAPYLNDVETELLIFPKGAHDDIVDNYSMIAEEVARPHGPVMWSVDTYDVTPQEPPRREDGTAMQMVEIERVDMFEMHNEFAEVGQFYDMGGY